MLEEELEILCGDVGKPSPSLFDKQALAFCSRYFKRDVVFEISPFDQLIPGCLLPPLLIPPPRGKSGEKLHPSKLVLMDMQNLETVKNIITSVQTAQRPFCQSCSVLGLNGTARDDLQEVERPSAVIFSTPQRIIDHIRRENISLAGVVNTTVLRMGFDEEDMHSFDQDILFITAKAPASASTHIYTSDLDDLRETDQFFRHPKVISRSDWCFANQSVHTFLHQELSADDVLRILYSRQVSEAFILCNGKGEKRQLEKILSTALVPFNITVSVPQEYLPAKAEDSHIMVVFGAHYPLLDMVFNPKTNPAPDVPEIIILHTPEQESNLKAIQENVTMKQTRQTKPEDSEVLSGKIKLLLDEVKQHKNPEELARIKRLMKKQVPFHLRSYLFAYLLQEKISEEGGSKGRQQRPEGSQEGMTTLFISIGKNKKVYPKDLTKIVKEQLGITDNEIGTVRVLDNYSFVNISKQYARNAVEQMNNMKFRGKTITVDYAKKKTV